MKNQYFFHLGSYEFITHRILTYFVLILCSFLFLFDSVTVYFLIVLFFIGHFYLGINAITNDYMHDLKSLIMFQFCIDTFCILSIKSCILIFLFL